MIRFWLILVSALTSLFVLPIMMIRAQSYDDRAIRELAPVDCPAPCLLGIRPGAHTLSEGIYFLEAHNWVATRVEQMPSVVQMSLRYGATIARTEVRWRWAANNPAWINDTLFGVITVENLDVKLMTIDTYLTVGDIALAFGSPDAVWVRDRHDQRFEYNAWYDERHMLITAEGLCPLWHVLHAPVHIQIYATSPRLAQPEATVCR